jgi:arylsulfatase A-like enzyme
VPTLTWASLRTCFSFFFVVSVFAVSPGCESTPQWSCLDCNVVLISIDTLRADHVGAYGYDKPTTPVLDELAGNSVLFERAVSQSSWTRPAHMSIMTGLYPAEHGFVALADNRRLEDTVPTLASVLKAQGWQTVAFTGGLNVSASFGFDSGFDLYRNNGSSFRDNLEEFRWWLENEREDRFFLFLHGYDAHTPYEGFSADREALDLDEKRPRKSYRKTCNKDPSARSLAPFLAEYDAAIHRADRYVGKMLDELRSRGLLENTLLVVTSDHGEEFGEHGGCFHLSTLHREVLDVPLLIAGPDLTPRRVATLVPASVSIAPTIADAVLGKGHELPGPSLLPALTGGALGEQEVWSQTERSTEHTRGQGVLHALTVPGRKLLHYPTLGREEAYDLITDPLETVALEGQSSPELIKALDRRKASHPAQFPSRRKAKGSADDAESEVDEELEKQLQTLGYAD